MQDSTTNHTHAPQQNSQEQEERERANIRQGRKEGHSRKGRRLKQKQSPWCATRRQMPITRITIVISRTTTTTTATIPGRTTSTAGAGARMGRCTDRGAKTDGGTKQTHKIVSSTYPPARMPAGHWHRTDTSSTKKDCQAQTTAQSSEINYPRPTSNCNAFLRSP